MPMYRLKQASFIYLMLSGWLSLSSGLANAQADNAMPAPLDAAAETAKIMAEYPQASPKMVQADQMIKYCEYIGDRLEQYSHSEDLFGDLLLAAKRLAVETLFKEELAGFTSKTLSQQQIVDALRNLIQYDDVIKVSDGLLSPCVGLQNARISEADKARFKPQQIGKICDYRDGYVTQTGAEMRQALIDILKGRGTTDSKTPIMAMMDTPENIQPQLADQLQQYIHEEILEPDPHALDNTQCKSLYVYPVELYVASTGREISSLITVQPPVVAYDSEKRKAEINLVVISKNYYWDLASTDKVMRLGAGLVDDFTLPFYHDDFQLLAQSALREIVCIGMASCEGKEKRENARAKERTLKLTGWLNSAFRNTAQGLKIYGVNLGKHQISGDECRELDKEVRDAQRRILLVGITKNSDEEVNVEEALVSAMQEIAESQPQRLPINPVNYNLFEIIELAEN